MDTRIIPVTRHRQPSKWREAVLQAVFCVIIMAGTIAIGMAAFWAITALGDRVWILVPVTIFGTSFVYAVIRLTTRKTRRYGQKVGRRSRDAGQVAAQPFSTVAGPHQVQRPVQQMQEHLLRRHSGRG